MARSIRASTIKRRKKPGPPRTTGPGEQVVVRLHNPLLGAIDAWRASEVDKPTRAEAIRRLLERALSERPGAAGWLPGARGRPPVDEQDG